MKKVSVSSLLAGLALAAFAVAPGTVSQVGTGWAQDAAAAAAPAGQVQMDPKEYEAYENAVNKQTTPQTQAPALEAYLTAYPNSAVKADVLQRLMVDYSQFDPAKAVTAADNVLKVDPNNLRADLIEVYLRRQTAEAITDPTKTADRQAGLDAAASYAQKGLTATKPTAMSDADWTTLTGAAYPTFYSAIGTAALSKKDTAAAIDAYKKELAAVPVAQTTAVGTPLQDTYYLGQAYYQQPTPDYVNCTFYATRAYSYAPPQFQAQMPLAAYCYKKYHGGTDGYDAVVAAAKANLNPPDGFSIVPAPTPADQVANLIKTTPDLATLALSDKEYVLANGKPEDADKVFATIKGKQVGFPQVLVIKATPDQMQVAVTDDAVNSKTADFTFNFAKPLTKVPDVGSKIDIAGTYSSYTASPVMIVMDNSELVEKKAPVRKPPVRRR